MYFESSPFHPADRTVGTAAPSPIKVSDAPVMTRQVRAVAAVTFAMTAAAATAFAFGAVTLGLLLTVVQVSAFVAAIRKPGRHPYRGPARVVAGWFPPGEPEHPLPLRFAAQVGLGFMMATLVAAVFTPPAAALFAAACSVAAALNAFANLCLACRLYPLLRNLRARVVQRHP